MPGLSKQHRGQWELLQLLLLLLLHCGFANGGFSHKEKLATLIDPFGRDATGSIPLLSLAHQNTWVGSGNGASQAAHCTVKAAERAGTRQLSQNGCTCMCSHCWTP